MEADYIDIKLAKRRQIFFGTLIALVIVGSIVLYFWGKVLNKGTILIYAETPFTAHFYERKEVFECKNSPCEIVQPMGEKSFYISKDGYEAIFDSEKIKLWRTVEKKIEMKKKPHFLKTEDEPIELGMRYSFEIDEENNMQKLFNLDDPGKKAIVYFPKALEDPIAFGDKKRILVADKANPTTTYKVNVEEKSKDLLPEIKQFKIITGGKWSNDGKFFAVSIFRQPNLWIMDEAGSLEQTSIEGNINLAAWRKDNEMVVANREGIILYDPLNKKREDINFSNSLDENPSKIFSINDGEILFVKAGENFYKLILE